MPDEGQFVESGSFKVDRARALDKLMRFQLEKPERYLLPWVRAGVASHATAIDIDYTDLGLSLSFDGDVIPEAQLRDPYGTLLGDFSDENTAARHIAIGLLAALRLKPAGIKIDSGIAGKRRSLVVKDLQEDDLKRAKGPETKTIINAHWHGPDKELARQHMTELKGSCLVSPIPIRVNGNELKRWTRGPERTGIYFEAGSAFGWITPADGEAEESRFDAYVLGVSSGQTTFSLPAAQVRGYVNDNRFRLNASQSSIVVDSRWKEVKEVIAQKTELLTQQIIEEQIPRMNQAARLVRKVPFYKIWETSMRQESDAPTPVNRNQWLADIGVGIAAYLGLTSRNPKDIPAFLRETAKMTTWLRTASRRMPIHGAPLFFSVGGKVLTYKQAKGARSESGSIMYVQGPWEHRNTLDPATLWCCGAHDVEDLKAQFDNKVKEIKR
ncbi:MAG: hypothetical protein COB53_10125 [Elusimicrobia bacterium]|nr:MAG: hypothetical protein COB53_10125 [Elusimicrobiota bacterium]